MRIPGILLLHISTVAIISAALLASPVTLNENDPLLPPRRAHHALVYDELNNCVLMTAGSTPLNGGSSFNFFDDSWCFDGGSWKENAGTGERRSGIQLAFDSKRKKIYSFGGFTGDSSCSDLRVLENGKWVTISYLPGNAAAEPGFIYDSGRDRFVVFGGSGGRGQVNGETWEWDGENWIRFDGKNPPGRQAFAMIYDINRKKTVLYGGMGTTPADTYSDTWEYNGKAWTKLADSGPGARMSHGFAFDSKKNIFLIFGGMGPNGFLKDTWGWNGSEWELLAIDGPAARAMGYLAYDAGRDKTILFGGRIGWPNDVNDTWEWNGSNWKEIK